MEVESKCRSTLTTGTLTPCISLLLTPHRPQHSIFEDNPCVLAERIYTSLSKSSDRSFVPRGVKLTKVHPQSQIFDSNSQENSARRRATAANAQTWHQDRAGNTVGVVRGPWHPARPRCGPFACRRGTASGWAGPGQHMHHVENVLRMSSQQCPGSSGRHTSCHQAGRWVGCIEHIMRARHNCRTDRMSLSAGTRP